MAGISDVMEFSKAVRRHTQRRRYRKIPNSNGGGKKLRIVKLGSSKGFAWRFRFVPKLKLRIKNSAAKVCPRSWISKIKDGYVNMMFNLAHSKVKEASTKRVEEFNNKVVIEIYKSLGLQVQVLPNKALLRDQRQKNLESIVV